MNVQEPLQRGFRMAKKKKYTCWHAHDYSTIEHEGKSFLEISNPEPMDEDDPEEIKEREKVVARVELVTKALNQYKK